MLNRPFGAALILVAVSILLIPGSPASGQNPSSSVSDQNPIRLSSIFDPVNPQDVQDSGFIPTREIFRLPAGVEPIYYIGIQALITVLDGGPNIDKNAYLSNAYSDALNEVGMGGIVSLELRISPQIYFRAEMGTVLFTSGGSITDNLGDVYDVGNLSILFASVGGTFTYPLIMLGDEPETATDLEGFQAFVRFSGGFRYILETDAESDTGERFAFWHSNGGFCFHIGVGAEYRVGLFAAVIEASIRTFEGPAPATHPRELSNGEMILTYPIGLGFSMKF